MSTIMNVMYGTTTNVAEWQPSLYSKMTSKQSGGETTDASHPQSQYQQAAISYEELAICNKQTSNREEMATLATGISFQV